MELKISEIKALEPIKFNFEQLKQEITTKVENYKNIVYTEENIKEAKTDRANLNKLAKALNDEKIRVKNIVLEPYVPFEKQCLELIELVKVASDNADTQIKKFEQNKKDEKLKQIVAFFGKSVEEYAELIDFDKIYNEKWLNATYKMEQIEKEILHIIAKTKTDLAVIDTQFQDENINKIVKTEYFNQISDVNVLILAILKGNQTVEQTKKLEELKQKESLSKNIQNVSDNTKNITTIPQSITESEQKTIQLDFRVWVTKEQMSKLKEFLIENNIKYGKVV